MNKLIILGFLLTLTLSSLFCANNDGQSDEEFDAEVCLLIF
jgi:hypothetical protein